MTHLNELITRVEGASGPDEELDALILCALMAPAGCVVVQSAINGAWCVYTKPGRLWEQTRRDGTWRLEGWAVTASLDAALALCSRVLPGWLWEIGCASPPGHWARVYIDPLSVPPAASAPTPALSVCLAILRAKASDHG